MVGYVVRKKTTGAVYWHDEDQEDWEHGGCVDLKYAGGYDDELDYGDDQRLFDENTRQVGKKFSDALEQAEVEFDWDGDPGSCIKVTGCFPKKEWRGEHFVEQNDDEDGGL
jgi:hypothetical protein